MTAYEKPPQRVARSGGSIEKLLCGALLFGCLTITGVRPLIQETHDTARQPFAQTSSELPEIGPLPTLWINWVIVGIFGLTMALRRQGCLKKPRRTGLALGFLIVAIAACASLFAASNKRLAINATLDWITLPLLAIALAHLLQHKWQMRLALCVIVASGCASAIDSFDYYFFGQPDTVRMYEQTKEEFWQRQGVAPDSYQVALFEKRLNDRVVKGFFNLSNIAGSYFVLTVFAALGLAVSSWKRRRFAVSILGLAGLMLVTLFLTKSAGAIVALACGLVVVGLILLFRKRIAANRRRVFVLGWCVVLAGLAATATYGFSKGALPGSSLTFRWWYLEATAKMVADHPLFGVGSEQYGRHYTRYKEIKSPEEISDPHNFPAHAAAEWGLAGLLGIMVMLIGGSKVVSGTLRPGNSELRMQHDESGLQAAGLILWGSGLLVAIWVLRIIIEGHPNFNYVYAKNTLPLIGWAVVFALGAAAIASGHESNANRMSTRNEARGSWGVWLAAGLFAFLLHNLISFSLFVPGSATTFFALLGVCVAVRNEEGGSKETQTKAKHRPLLLTPITFATLISLTLLYVFCIQPVSRCWRYLQQARAATAGEHIPESRTGWFAGEIPDKSFALASESDPLDPTPCAEFAQGWLRVGPPERNMIFSSHAYDSFRPWDAAQARAAIARDPENIASHRLLVSRLLQHFSLEHYPRETVLAQEKVLELYPSNPKGHARMAAIQARVYQMTGEKEALDRAIIEMEKAIELDGQRPLDEIRRFSPATLERLEAELARLRFKVD